jgi:acetylornithine/succinyldiaminopimelate/putrescine aminotransferase
MSVTEYSSFKDMKYVTNQIQVFCLPPLIITPEQIREGFDIFDKCLHIMDDAMEK